MQAAARLVYPRENRAAWMIEQHQGVGIVSNGKFGPAIALAQLALNLNDANAISWDTALKIMLS